MFMDSTAELKYRREAAEFIQEMAEQLNHNILRHRGHLPNFLHMLQQEDNCMFAFIWLVDVQIMKCERFEPN
uniref:Uncharacterized protein n=1 Tax=Meloidogyne enterolobii TaxID=390850 RepID=A0A6V7UGF5_MELEN|nr:unnamed protein product [Meloidogyne enterolobii]